jgi:hypothetical protein
MGESERFSCFETTLSSLNCSGSSPRGTKPAMKTVEEKIPVIQG